jgi:hypothetical protein
LGLLDDTERTNPQVRESQFPNNGNGALEITSQVFTFDLLEHLAVTTIGEHISYGQVKRKPIDPVPTGVDETHYNST